MTPCDGNFTEHKYLGDKLTVDLKKDEIRAFVAKLAVRSESCPEEYNGQINKINKMTKAANTGIDTDHANANADENEKEGQYKDQQNENGKGGSETSYIYYNVILIYGPYII